MCCAVDDGKGGADSAPRKVPAVRGIRPLRTAAEIRAVGLRGTSVARRGLRLTWLANHRRENRLAVRIRGVGRKLNAVRRNQCRRRLREACRRQCDGLPQGYDLLLMVQCPPTPPRFTELQETLETLRAAWLQRAAPPSSL